MGLRLGLAVATTVALVGVAVPATAGPPTPGPGPEPLAPWAGGCIVPAILWLDPSPCASAPPAPEPFSAPRRSPRFPELAPPGSCMSPALYTGPMPGGPCPPVPPRERRAPTPCVTPAPDDLLPRVQPGC